MAKKDVSEGAQQKVQTKYDRKMEERRQQKLKDEREEKIAKSVSALIGLVIAALVVVTVVASVVRKNNALNGTYVKIGDYAVSELAYDYYYNATVNSYLTNYGSLLPYMGLDTSVDFDKQQYTDEMTWKDMFDQMTVEQIRQNKALLDDAQAAGFSYDAESEYETFEESIKQSAANAGRSLKNYYKETFGDYATPQNIEGFVKESIIADAYYTELMKNSAADADEIQAYYAENTQKYDQVDYRSFTFKADVAEDASEEDITAAMDALEAQADTMMADYQAGGDFEALCVQNASEEEKADYEDTETEKSLSEGKYYDSIASAMGTWLYEDGRTEGDLTVIRDDASKSCYVVEFLKRYYDASNDSRISAAIASDRVTKRIASLVEKYDVTDVKGELKYLTIPAAEDDGTASDETSAEEEAAEE